MSDNLLIKKDGHITTITINRPDIRNAISDEEMTVALVDAINDLNRDPDVRVAILTGAGKVFSAGADIRSRKAVGDTRGGRYQHIRRVRESFHAIRECTKPVIAAINGPALGAGLALAASCDILIAAEEASLGLPEIDVGLLGGGRHSMRLFAHSRLRRMMFTGYRVPGPELYRLGVVELCVPRAELMDAALKLAAEIASKSPTAMRLAKQSLNTIEELSLRDGYRYEQNMTLQLSGHPDSQEAMAAFLEKRKPKFSGS